MILRTLINLIPLQTKKIENMNLRNCFNMSTLTSALLWHYMFDNNSIFLSTRLSYLLPFVAHNILYLIYDSLLWMSESLMHYTFSHHPALYYIAELLLTFFKRKHDSISFSFFQLSLLVIFLFSFSCVANIFRERA